MRSHGPSRRERATGYAQAICWLRTNRSGTRLYTTNTGFGDTSTISVYDITDPDDPKEIQNVTLIGQGNATQFELSTDEKHLFAMSQRFSARVIPSQREQKNKLKIRITALRIYLH